MSQRQYLWLPALAVFSLSACMPKDAENNSPSAPFSLPPQDGFVLDYNAMSSAQSKAIVSAVDHYDYSDSAMSKVIQDYSDSAPSQATQGFLKISNHSFAAFRVAAWNVLTAVGMAIPKASFLEAFKHSPTPLADGIWQWAYSLKVGLHTYHAKLQGQLLDGQVNWEMYLSRADGEFTDVNWYSGSHDIAMTAGDWTLRQRADDGVLSDLIQIDWQRDPTAGTRHIRYTNVNDNGYIENGVTASGGFDAYFNINNTDLPAVINIEWDKADKSGRVKSSNTVEQSHFGHAEWNCWQGTADTDPYDDTACVE
jgi:hypothetical protein